MNDNDVLTIGQIAHKMGITVRTLQYYDQEDILKPSSLSKGGRRLYSSKDVITLSQILSLKYLGFSLEDIKNKISNLDTPEKVVSILEKQEKTIEGKIRNLQEILTSLVPLKTEVLKMNCVDFNKYADIIAMIRMGIENENMWVLNAFDDALNEHLRNRFGTNPELGEQISETYLQLLDEGIHLKRTKESSKSEKSMDFAKKWWKMVNDFTGGDLSLLPKLQEFNQDKSKWDEEMAIKQKEIDGFMEEVLENYFKKCGSNL